MADTPEPMVPVRVKHKTSGKVKVINPAALDRYTETGFVQVDDDDKPVAKTAVSSGPKKEGD